MNNFEKLLVFATVISPFTLLRFGIMGLGEVTFILLFLNEIKYFKFKKVKNYFVFSAFWISFLFVSFLGFLYNVIFLEHKTGTIGGMFFDFSSYIMLLITCIVIENRAQKGQINFFLVLKNLFIYSAIVFTILFVLSKFTSSIAGLQLRYYTFFSPLSNNLHQTSMFMVPLPFLGLYFFENEKNNILKLLYLFFIGAFLMMITETGSFKAVAGIVLASFFYLSLKIVYKTKGKIRTTLIGAILISLFFLTLFNYEVFYELLSNLFAEEDLNGGRANIYSSAFEVGMSSPIIGLGPGGHVWDNGKFWDAHQTLLSVFIQSGIIGIFLILKLIFNVIKKTLKMPSIFAALIPILIYALGGDILRRMPIWIFLVLFYYYSITSSKLLKK